MDGRGREGEKSGIVIYGWRFVGQHFVRTCFAKEKNFRVLGESLC